MKNFCSLKRTNFEAASRPEQYKIRPVYKSDSELYQFSTIAASLPSILSGTLVYKAFVLRSRKKGMLIEIF